MPAPENHRDILYFGNDWFAENRTSSHHIARCLARQNRVFYLECPGLRAPKGSARDVRKLFSKLWRFLRGVQTVVIPGDSEQRPETTLYVRTLFQIPLHRFALIRWMNTWLLWLTIRWLMLRRGIHQPVAWHMVPHLARVAGTLKESKVVYYCIDDYASLPDVDAASVRAMDVELTRRSDVVFVASATLLESKKQLNPNTHVSPHGVDTAHFAKAQLAETPVPSDIAPLPKPIIGFFGLIERWIDLDLIAALAERRPDWTFVMIGRVAVAATELPSQSNIHFFGQRSYDVLPGYGRAFDVAIIPYRSTTQVLHANPIKLREYLAMGKPVVTVSSPEIEKFRDVVAIATSTAQFEELITAALEKNQSSACEIRRRQDRVKDMSWDSVVARAWSLATGPVNHL